jgi:hypothetical protein
MRPNIGLIGKLGSGKDTAANILSSNYGYGRVSFAYPLKKMVIAADPIIKYEPSGYGPVSVRLSDILRQMSFEDAKREYPEVRRSLQRIGQGVRQIDPRYWVRIALSDVEDINRASVPAVITDVRYQNEAEALRSRGFKLIRITRPAASQGYTREESALMLHASETDLDKYAADATIPNTGTVEELHDAIAALVK